MGSLFRRPSGSTVVKAAVDTLSASLSEAYILRGVKRQAVDTLDLVLAEQPRINGVRKAVTDVLGLIVVENGNRVVTRFNKTAADILNVLPGEVATVSGPGTLSLSGSSFSVTEFNSLNFNILRGQGDINRIRVTWTLTLAQGSPSPTTGTVTFLDRDSAPKPVSISLLGVTSTTVGTLTLSNPENLDGGSVPSFGVSSASVSVQNDNVAPSSVGLMVVALNSSSVALTASGGTDTGSGFKDWTFQRMVGSTWTNLVVQTSPSHTANFLPTGLQQFRVIATDKAGNQTISSVASVNLSSLAIRFNPGHYMNVDVGSGGGGLSGWISQINSIANEPTVPGVKIALNPDDVEPTTRGVYNWSILDQIVNACANINKKLMLSIDCQWFGSSPTNPVGRIPTHVINSGWVWQWDGTGSPAGNLALALRLDRTDCMGWFIELGQAIAGRYNSGGTVEIYQLGETAMAVPSSTGWTTVNWIARMKDWGLAMRLAWAQTGVRIATNYLDTDAQMKDFIEFCDANQIIGGGPDNYSRIYQSNPFYTGNKGGIDHRPTMGWVSENQRPAESSGGTTATSAQIYEHNENGALADGGSTWPHYYIWYKPYLGETWAQVLNFIRSINGKVNTSNPYSSGSMVSFNFDHGNRPAFFNSYAGGTITTEQSYSNNKSLKCTANAGSFDLNYLAGKPLHRLSQGDEIWVRFRTLFELGYDFTHDGGGLKFFRIDHGPNSGVNRGHGAHLDWYLQSGGPTAAGYWNWINEAYQSWMFTGVDRPASGVVRGIWQTWNFYCKLHSTAAGSRVMMWRDSTLIFDRSTRASLGSPTDEVGSVQDINAQGIMFMTYWNGGSPRTQSVHVDDFDVSTNISGVPKQRDSAGNIWIGL